MHISKSRSLNYSNKNQPTQLLNPTSTRKRYNNFGKYTARLFLAKLELADAISWFFYVVSWRKLARYGFNRLPAIPSATFNVFHHPPLNKHYCSQVLLLLLGQDELEVFWLNHEISCYSSFHKFISRDELWSDEILFSLYLCCFTALITTAQNQVSGNKSRSPYLTWDHIIITSSSNWIFTWGFPDDHCVGVAFVRSSNLRLLTHTFNTILYVRICIFKMQARQLTYTALNYLFLALQQQLHQRTCKYLRGDDFEWSPSWRGRTFSSEAAFAWHISYLWWCIRM